MVLFGCSNAGESELSPSSMPAEIEAKLQAQEEAWNRGDARSFMELAYWQDDRLIFIGSRGPTYGFEATLANYLKSYPNAEAMGNLHFELLDWRSLGTEHGLLVGSWALKRGGDWEDLAGHFSLVWERQDGNWVIIADHSS